jgi:ABC-type dipeptide/oligopeptide/nickel transport systems, permease components
MRSYILRRLLLMIPTLIGISLVCFILIQLLPGGPVEEMISRAQQAAAMKGGVDASKALSPDQIAQIQAYFGFDQPAWKRYLTWLWNVLHLDLGSSYTYGLPVWDVIVSRFPISLFFGITSFFLSLPDLHSRSVCGGRASSGSKLDSLELGYLFSRST